MPKKAKPKYKEGDTVIPVKDWLKSKMLKIIRIDLDYDCGEHELGLYYWEQLIDGKWVNFNNNTSIKLFETLVYPCTTAGKILYGK